MKRIISKLVALCLLVSLVGCGSTEKQDAIMKYMNEDIAEMLQIESDMVDSYNSVTGSNYTDDLAMYTEFTENTIVLANKLCDKTASIASNITDDELLAVHNLYCNYSQNFVQALDIIIVALENQDTAQVEEGSAKLDEANSFLTSYQQKLLTLMENNGIEFEE